MARQAVECFRAQTYQNKRLLVWDTSEDDNNWFHPRIGETAIESNAFTGHDTSRSPIRRAAIGELRNEANASACEIPALRSDARCAGSFFSSKTPAKSVKIGFVTALTPQSVLFVFNTLTFRPLILKGRFLNTEKNISQRFSDRLS
jgi:hypothetical protein